MRMKKNTLFSFLIVLLSLLTKLYAELNTRHQSSNLDIVHEIQVGVILDMGSSVGKVVHSCITMAISDFYALNAAYKTKVVLHTRDSKGEPLHALSAALDLLENVKVQAIVGLESSPGGEFLPLLSDKARVPIMSFSTSHWSNEYPYFIQIRPDETTEFKGIFAIVESFRWRNVFVYEDTDYGREIPPNLANSFPDVHITYMSVISPSTTDDQIHEELHKLMTMQTTIFIAHMSPSLASRFFLIVKRLGMMTEGYAWILTGKTTNLLHSVDASAIDSMQGVLGFKSYIPTSVEFQNFTVRWKEKFRIEGPNFEVAELNILGLWAYDAVWALAKAIERVGFENPPTGKHGMGLNLTDLPNIGASRSGSILLNEILKTRFMGLRGKFQFVNGSLISEAFEVVNVIGRGERRVGFWNATTEGMYRYCINGMFPCVENGLEAIIWPGGSTTTPKGWLMQMGVKKLRIGVHQSPGFEELVHVDRDPQTNATIVTGFCIDVFNSAIEALPYEVPYDFIAHEGSYQDLIHQVYLRNFDAVVGDVTITANRSLYVDFTSTFTDVGVGTIAPIGNKKNMWVFLKPLDAELWLTIAGFFILIGFVIWIVEHPINEAFQGSRAQQFGNALWFSLSTLVFAHRENLLSNLSRFVMIVWMFVVLILTTSYTATLTSMLTIQQIQLASKGNTIGYQGAAFVNEIIGDDWNYTDPLIMLNSPEEYANALSSGRVVAVVDEFPYLKIFLAKYPAGYGMVASKSISNGFGFVFQKGSPLVPEISREIMKLRERGKLMMLENAWFKSSSSLMSTQDVVTNPNTLGLGSFHGLFLISGISLVLVLVIRLIYFLHGKWHEKISSFRILAWGKLMFLLKYLPSKNAIVIAQRNAR